MPTLLERYHQGEAKISRVEQEVDLSKHSAPLQRVWGLLDRECPVKYLIANGRMAEFDLYTTLEALRELRLIEIHATEATEEISTAPGRRGASADEPKHVLQTMGIVALSATLLLAAWVWMPAKHLGPRQDQLSAEAERWRSEAEQAQLEALLDLYYGANGKYPKTLSGLQAVGLLDVDIQPSALWSYSLRPGEASYDLERKTPNPAS
jgi:hypothetical protein